MASFPDEATRTEMEQLLSHPLHFPEEFKRWMGDFISTNIPMIPFSHIFGAKINIARSGDYISTSETKATTGYGDLPTVGPQITGLADGKYLIAFGIKARQSASLSYNGSAPSDDDAINANESNPNGGRMIIKTLASNNNNTVCVKYKNGTFQDRWLVVIRVGAPGEN